MSLPPVVVPVASFVRDVVGKVLVSVGAATGFFDEERDECAFWCAVNGMQRTLRDLFVGGTDPDATVNRQTAL